MDILHRPVRRARTHAGIAMVMLAGLLLRLLAQIGYGPALYYYDSVSYVERSAHGLFLSPDQPAGYPIAIRIVRWIGGGLGAVTALQHLAGLIAGLLVYLMICRLTSRRWLAAAGAAAVVLDGYAIAVEQYVMTEALFDLLVTASAWLAILGRRRWTVAAGGALLAVACMVRPVGLFCTPVWLVVVLWRYRFSLATLLCAAAMLLPLFGYMAANDAATGNFAMTEDSAWLLYGRIGAIGDCRGLGIPAGERVLCPHAGQRNRSVAFYLFAARSPAVEALGTHSVHAPPRVDRLLSGYALRVISGRPLQFAGRVGGDLLRFFVPGARSDYPTEDGPITFPPAGPWLWPFYHPHQRSPARLLRDYVSVIHTVRPMLAVFLAMGILALLVRPIAHAPGVAQLRRPAIAMLIGMSLALMLGSALSHFERRYVLPTVPLLATCGMTAIATLWERARGRFATVDSGLPRSASSVQLVS